MTFGARLLKRRLELELTREEVAGTAKTTHQSIWRYEKDLKAPDANTIIRLAKALKCTVGSLFGESDQNLTKEATLEAVRKLVGSRELSLEEIAEVVIRPKKKRQSARHE